MSAKNIDFLSAQAMTYELKTENLMRNNME